MGIITPKHAKYKSLYSEAYEKVRERLLTCNIKLENTHNMVFSRSPLKTEQRNLRLNPSTQKMELQIIHPQQKSLAVIPQNDDPFDPDIPPREGNESIKNASPELKKEWAKKPLVP